MIWTSGLIGWKRVEWRDIYALIITRAALLVHMMREIPTADLPVISIIISCRDSYSLHRNTDFKWIKLCRGTQHI